jgi:hypothetical protein
VQLFAQHLNESRDRLGSAVVATIPVESVRVPKLRRAVDRADAVADFSAILDELRSAERRRERFAADALLRQGHAEAALARAAALLEGDRAPWGHHDIARFCEAVLHQQGRPEEAYRRFGLPSASGNTWLAMWRDLVKRYPERDPREVLEDLIEWHGRKGKWFAAAKSAGYLDIALDCAAAPEAAPATLIRASRDFAASEPVFATRVALHAVAHLLAGRGYDASPRDIDAAIDHAMAASRAAGRVAWATEELRTLAGRGAGDDLMAGRLRARLAELDSATGDLDG